MELAQLQEGILQLVLSAETVGVEFGPGGSQLLQLLGDVRTILQGQVAMEIGVL